MHSFLKRSMGMILWGAVGVMGGSVALADGVDNTLFLHHFDATVGQGASTADYANGNPAQLIGPPSGPGGTIIDSNYRFGPASLNRSTGGRIQYETAGNFNVNQGTIEMWIYGPGVVSGGFRGLWGVDTPSFNANDIRMYIYDTGAGRTFGAYMGSGSGNTFWEIEQAIPSALLTDNEWHHVAWAYDCNAGVTATWWDGQLLRNTPDAGTITPRVNFTGTSMHIGENQAGSATWPGLQDEVRISDVIRYPTNGNFVPPTAPFVVPEPGSLAVICLGAGLLAQRRVK